MKPNEIPSIFACPDCHCQITIVGLDRDILENIQVYCNQCRQKFLLMAPLVQTPKIPQNLSSAKPIVATQENFCISESARKVSSGEETSLKETGFDILNESQERISKVSKYGILNKIGQGAMGVIYLAEDMETKKKVALKLLTQNMQKNEKATKRFLQEAEVHRQLDHPNIVHVYEAGYDKGAGYYMAMEYIDGYNLEKILSKNPLSLKYSLQIALQIGYALDYAYDRHIIHRDLKPGNILIDTVSRKVKVLDFGLGKILQEEGSSAVGGLTEGEFLGTPYYMPPEQIKNPREVDHRADIYALGATFYQMLSGKAPYSEKKTTFAVIKAKSQEPPEPLENCVPGIPESIVNIVEKAMARDLKFRYATPGLMLADMQKVWETLL